MRNTIYAFTLSTKSDCYEKDDCIFDENGMPLGRVLRKQKIDNNDFVQYSYDIESTKEIYNALKKGAIKLDGINEYSVCECSMSYYQE